MYSVSGKSLPSHDNTNVQCNKCTRDTCHSKSSKPLNHIITAVVHILVAFSLTMILLRTSLVASTQPPKWQSALPITESLSYVATHPAADAWGPNPYTFKPSHESNMAWEKLQKVRGISLSPDEAKTMNVPLTGLRSNGHGRVASILGVQHNLHCIRIIRQVLYPNYYYPNSTMEERAALVGHAGHCLESLRQSVMCVPDLAPRSVLWEDEHKEDIKINPSVNGLMCLRWESLVEWAVDEQRDFTLTDLQESNP